MKDKLYSIEVAVEQVEGEVKSVLFVKCDCSAGKPCGSCKHFAAFMYAPEEFYRLGYTREKVAVTSELQTWNIPRERNLPHQTTTTIFTYLMS